MREEKAYKLLSLQEGISNRKAKELIDKGVVYALGKRVGIARALMDVGTTFKLEKIQKPSLIYESDDFLVLDKPALVLSEDLEKEFGYPLLHRLDKETSGVLVLAKNEDLRLKAIEEFKKMRVEKIYYAIVYGKMAEELEINSPILTTKTKNGAVSKLSQRGKEAISLVSPIMIEGKYTFVKVAIKTGRTHQIRVHLQSIGHPVLGDLKYSNHKANRMMLHSFSMVLMGQNFQAPLPSIFRKYGFSL
ncbi:MAG: RNA pseudouridine synthase [Proteobacteria bacterium]|nr:MAG: RNA pseudouridine synthase [Pseudomonadota bacterium]